METSAQKSLAVAEIGPIARDVQSFADTLEGIDIVDDDTQAKVGQFVKMIRARREALEKKRKSLVTPLNRVVREINELFRTPRERCDAIIEAGRAKMDTYAEAQVAIEREKKRAEREAAEAERAEAERIARELRETTGFDGGQIADTLERQAEEKVAEAAKPAKVEPVRGGGGAGGGATVSVRMVWRAEVVDMMALLQGVLDGKMPPDVLTVNTTRLTALAREDEQERTVCGVRFYQQVGTAVR